MASNGVGATIGLLAHDLC